MCARSQIYSPTKHFLLSAFGSRWNEKYLVMFTIYIDDSGSSPEQKVVVASGIIFPTRQLPAFEKAWNGLLQTEGITEFHTSVCRAHNPHSEFAGWDDARVKRVFAHVRRLTFKHSVKAFCIAIYKKDYSEVMPEDMRARVGSYYTWATSSVLGLAHDWAKERNVPMEYVFDTADKLVKREIDDAMECIEEIFPGNFMGHYLFRNRKDMPALQAVDLFAWTCFQKGEQARVGKTIDPLAKENWIAYDNAGGGEWCVVQSLNRQGIEDWVTKMYLSPEDLRLKKCKERLKTARIPKRKRQQST